MAIRMSIWVSGSKPATDLFWRSAGSGSRTTSHRRRGSKAADRHAGDLLATAPRGEIFTRLFFAELKHYADFNMDRMVFGGKGQFLEEWLKARKAAEQFGKAPFFLIQKTRMGQLVVLDVRGVRILRRGLRRGALLRPIVVFPVIKAIAFPARDVFAGVDWDVLREHAKRRKKRRSRHR